MRLTLLTMLTLCLCATINVWRHSGGGYCVNLQHFESKHTLPLKGLLALIIVMDHLALGVRAMPHPSVMSEFVDCGRMAVGAFFFLSGYGLTASYRRKKEESLNGFPGRHLRRILPALLTATAVWLVWRKISAGEEILASLAELAQGYTPLPSSWFVFVIVFLYIAFYLTGRWMKEPVMMCGAMWILTTVYIAAVHRAGFGYIWYIGVYAFCIGQTYACFEEPVRRWLEGGRLRLPAAMLTLTLLSALPYLYNLHGGHIRHVYIAAMHLTPVFAVLCIYTTGIWRRRALRFLGEISYEIYLVHPALVIVLTPVTDNWVALCFGVFSATIPAAWMLHKVCGTLAGQLTKKPL